MYQICTDRGTNVYQCAKYVSLLVKKCAHVFGQSQRYCIHMIQYLVSELHDTAGNSPHHQNLGKTSDASLTRIDSTRELSSPAFAINLDSHYNLAITTINTAP